MTDLSTALDQGSRDLEDAWSLRLAGRRDEQALIRLYERHCGLARERALQVLCDPRLAEDAVHDAFVDLWRTADAFDPQRTTVAVWICVLIHRRASAVARREALRGLGDERVREPHPASLTAEELAVLRFRRRPQPGVTAQSGEPPERVVDIRGRRHSRRQGERPDAAHDPEAA